ncbi:MAG TPA: hypothetical protein ENJ09_00280 [Planctomycetes bacterium]|nr:hypothetical protein [Planctomycetota bacterium]
MIDPELLSILVCPESHQPLRAATDEEVSGVNERIAAGTQKNVAGNQVAQPIDGGLVREDGKILYAIRDDIPVLLVEEGLPLTP